MIIAIDKINKMALWRVLVFYLLTTTAKYCFNGLMGGFTLGWGNRKKHKAFALCFFVSCMR